MTYANILWIIRVFWISKGAAKMTTEDTKCALWPLWISLCPLGVPGNKYSYWLVNFHFFALVKYLNILIFAALPGTKKKKNKAPILNNLYLDNPLVVEKQMHGFLMVSNKSFASEKIYKPWNTSLTRTWYFSSRPWLFFDQACRRKFNHFIFFWR